MASEYEKHSGSQSGLRRVLGPIDATCIVVGAIIGVGIFFTPTQVAAIAGSPGLAMTVWVIGGGIALLGALTFAELGSFYPRSGAQYDILRDAYSPLPAFLFVFCNATAIQAGAIAVIAVICSKHIGVALGFEIANPFALVSLSAALIIGLTDSLYRSHMASEYEKHSGSQSGLRRVLGPIDATCIVVGAIIGVGIFFTPTQVAAIAGSPGLAMTVWVIGGGIALLGALTFAELGSFYPRSGAQYDILRDAYSPLPAFLFVFCNATAIQAGAIAVIAVICSKHIGVALGFEIANPFALVSLSAALIIGLTAANALGVRWGSRIQNLTVCAKLLTLVVVTFLAVLAEPMSSSGAVEVIEDSSSQKHPLLLICAALLPAFFAYGGWQHALWMAGEIRQPKRNVPLAIVGGVLIVVTAYLLVNWAYLHLLGYQGVVESGTLAADAVASVWPKVGARLAGVAVAISAFGVLNAQLLSGPRLIHEMARDGRFFRSFAAVNRRFNTPLTSIALLGVLALVLLFATRHTTHDC